MLSLPYEVRHMYDPDLFLRAMQMPHKEWWDGGIPQGAWLGACELHRSHKVSITVRVAYAAVSFHSASISEQITGMMLCSTHSRRAGKCYNQGPFVASCSTSPKNSTAGAMRMENCSYSPGTREAESAAAAPQLGLPGVVKPLTPRLSPKSSSWHQRLGLVAPSTPWHSGLPVGVWGRCASRFEICCLFG